MTKVYCEKCRYAYRTLIDTMANIKSEMPLSEVSACIYYDNRRIQDINSNNDCSWFEHKNIFARLKQRFCIWITNKIL